MRLGPLAFKPRWMDEASRTTALIAALGGIFILALPHVEGLVRRLLRLAPLPAAMRARLLDFAGRVLLGLRAFHRAGRLSSFVFLTVVIWALDAVGVMIATHGYEMRVSFSLALLLLTGLGLGSALPSTPMCGNLPIRRDNRLDAFWNRPQQRPCLHHRGAGAGAPGGAGARRVWIVPAA
jgi:hypothetical protein